MKVALLISFLLTAGYASTAQIKLHESFKCYPDALGYTMAKPTASVSQQNLSAELTDEELVNEYLAGFTKMPDGTYSKTTIKKGYTYEVYIPATSIQLTITSASDKTEFNSLVAKLKAFIKANPRWTSAYFTSGDGTVCGQK